jgi:hypothetical protein
MTLALPFKTFEEQINKFVNYGTGFKEAFKTAKTEDGLEQLNIEVKKWVDEVTEYLRASFSVQQNEFARDFYNTSSQRFRIPGQARPVENRIKEEAQNLTAKLENLEYNVKIIRISDSLTQPTGVDLDTRKTYDTDDILELIVDKLYDVYDEYYYPILTILTYNGITLKRQDDERELAQLLENYSYIKIYPAGNEVRAQLTVEGRRYVEDKRKANRSNYEKINQDPAVLDGKIDEIKNELKKLGLGQEILFEELDELKQVNLKLTKKQLGQILKGKLGDLVLSKAIDSQVAKAIFNSIADEALKLTQ